MLSHQFNIIIQHLQDIHLLIRVELFRLTFWPRFPLRVRHLVSGFVVFIVHLCPKVEHVFRILLFVNKVAGAERPEGWEYPSEDKAAI